MVHRSAQLDAACSAHRDVDFNVTGLIDASDGSVVERYEYTPYGQRKVYSSNWAHADLDDDGDVDSFDLIFYNNNFGTADDASFAMLVGDADGSGGIDAGDGTAVNNNFGDASGGPLGPAEASFRNTQALNGASIIPLCEFGHQGLMHDEVVGTVYNRARIWLPSFGRFGQTDPLGYPDGLNRYAGYHVMWGGVDPTGSVRATKEELEGWSLAGDIALSVTNDFAVEHSKARRWFIKQLNKGNGGAFSNPHYYHVARIQWSLPLEKEELDGSRVDIDDVGRFEWTNDDECQCFLQVWLEKKQVRSRMLKKTLNIGIGVEDAFEDWSTDRWKETGKQVAIAAVTSALPQGADVAAAAVITSVQQLGKMSSGTVRGHYATLGPVRRGAWAWRDAPDRATGKTIGPICESDEGYKDAVSKAAEIMEGE